MTAVLTEDLSEQLGGAVGDTGLAGEVRSGVDEDDNPDDALDGIESTGNVSGSRDRVEDRSTCSLGGPS